MKLIYKKNASFSDLFRAPKIPSFQGECFSQKMFDGEGGDTAGGPVTWCYDSGSESAVSFGTPVSWQIQLVGRCRRSTKNVIEEGVINVIF